MMVVDVEVEVVDDDVQLPCALHRLHDLLLSGALASVLRGGDDRCVHAVRQ
jgi:hypothetical protein